MKVKLTRSELRECVENAVLRIVNEGKSLHKFKDSIYKYNIIFIKGLILLDSAPIYNNSFIL